MTPGWTTATRFATVDLEDPVHRGEGDGERALDARRPAGQRRCRRRAGRPGRGARRRSGPAPATSAVDVGTATARGRPACRSACLVGSIRLAVDRLGQQRRSGQAASMAATRSSAALRSVVVGSVVATAEAYRRGGAKDDRGYDGSDGTKPRVLLVGRSPSSRSAADLGVASIRRRTPRGRRVVRDPAKHVAGPDEARRRHIVSGKVNRSMARRRAYDTSLTLSGATGAVTRRRRSRSEPVGRADRPASSSTPLARLGG